MFHQNLNKNVTAAEDFIEVVVKGHIIAAALHFFKMDNVEVLPSSDYLLELDVVKKFRTSVNNFYQ